MSRTTALPPARAERLNELLEIALSSCFAKFDADAFVGCFPSAVQSEFAARAAKRGNNCLVDAHASLTAFVTQSTRAEFLEICKELNLESKLELLDRLAAEARSRPDMTHAPPATASVDDIVRAQRLAAKQAEKQRLQELLEKTRAIETEKTEALERAARDDAAAQATLDSLATTLNDVAAAAGEWRQGPVRDTLRDIAARS
eukprot:Amastigsp_a681178_45.p1 type:complete len:202 gc:universal Amastigsp_a681178_45:630-25(-)